MKWYYDPTDIDECNIGTSNCNQLCNNTMGSYNCSCKIGYELDTDEVTCIDINECNLNDGGYDGNCENTEGSYICLCPTGHHSLDGTGQNCTGLLTKAQKNLLSITYCAIKISIIYLDINECSSDYGGCDQYCNNSIGSYECSCSIGFSLSSDRHNCSGLSQFICKYNTLP